MSRAWTRGKASDERRIIRCCFLVLLLAVHQEGWEWRWGMNTSLLSKVYVAVAIGGFKSPPPLPPLPTNKTLFTSSSKNTPQEVVEKNPRHRSAGFVPCPREGCNILY
jgi:hypothetical protein